MNSDLSLSNFSLTAPPAGNSDLPNPGETSRVNDLDGPNPGETSRVSDLDGPNPGETSRVSDLDALSFDQTGQHQPQGDEGARSSTGSSTLSKSTALKILQNSVGVLQHSLNDVRDINAIRYTEMNQKLLAIESSLKADSRSESDLESKLKHLEEAVALCTPPTLEKMTPSLRRLISDECVHLKDELSRLVRRSETTDELVRKLEDRLQHATVNWKNTLETRINLLEADVPALSSKLSVLDGKVRSIDERFATRIDQLEQKQVVSTSSVQPLEGLRSRIEALETGEKLKSEFKILEEKLERAINFKLTELVALNNATTQVGVSNPVVVGSNPNVQQTVTQTVQIQLTNTQEVVKEYGSLLDQRYEEIETLFNECGPLLLSEPEIRSALELEQKELELLEKVEERLTKGIPLITPSLRSTICWVVGVLAVCKAAVLFLEKQGFVSDETLGNLIGYKSESVLIREKENYLNKLAVDIVANGLNELTFDEEKRNPVFRFNVNHLLTGKPSLIMVGVNKQGAVTDTYTKYQINDNNTRVIKTVSATKMPLNAYALRVPIHLMPTQVSRVTSNKKLTSDILTFSRVNSLKEFITKESPGLKDLIAKELDRVIEVNETSDWLDHNRLKHLLYTNAIKALDEEPNGIKPSNSSSASRMAINILASIGTANASVQPLVGVPLFFAGVASFQYGQKWLKNYQEFRRANELKQIRLTKLSFIKNPTYTLENFNKVFTMLKHAFDIWRDLKYVVKEQIVKFPTEVALDTSKEPNLSVSKIAEGVYQKILTKIKIGNYSLGELQSSAATLKSFYEFVKKLKDMRSLD